MMTNDDNMTPDADAVGSDDMSSDMPAENMAGEAAMPASGMGDGDMGMDETPTPSDEEEM